MPMSCLWGIYPGDSEASLDGGRKVTYVVGSLARFVLVAGAAVVVAFAGGGEAQASTCGHSWAKPGKYKISGSFRGKNDSTNAFLSKDCRITLQVPGVFTGGKVTKRGDCLEFAFKVEGEKGAFKARWCEDYGLVPWRGETISGGGDPAVPCRRRQENQLLTQSNFCPANQLSKRVCPRRCSSMGRSRWIG